MNLDTTREEDELFEKILTLNDTAWENRVDKPAILRWLDNFNLQRTSDAKRRERFHALYLLSQFTYFGSRQMRELLKALYRDLYKYPIIEQLRMRHRHTTDFRQLSLLFAQQLRKTRFLGIGNPSESGCHLLYFFRQENNLPKDLFIHAHQIFKRSQPPRKQTLREPSVQHYVFIDDLCGSGDQGTAYSEDIVAEIKRLKPKAKVSYLVLFATSAGKRELEKTQFDNVNSVVELDDTFRVFGKQSRYFAATPRGIDKATMLNICQTYGETLSPSYPLGYKDSQLMLGFHHNTPDNTLPIMWWDNRPIGSWIPIFRRYPKVYSA